MVMSEARCFTHIVSAVTMVTKDCIDPLIHAGKKYPIIAYMGDGDYLVETEPSEWYHAEGFCCGITLNILKPRIEQAIKFLDLSETKT